MRIGVLALQGAFVEHITCLEKIGVETLEVRLPKHLAEVDGIIIPGGESTAIARIAEEWGLIEPLSRWVSANRPVWGTCAGLILLANHVVGQKEGGQQLIGGLDVSVARNFFGSQVNSFEAELSTPFLAQGNEPCVSTTPGSPTFRSIFIRAPAVLHCGPGVDTLASVRARPGHRSTRSKRETGDGEGEKEVDVAVAVRQGNIMGTSFHPELSEGSDLRWHAYFVSIVRASLPSSPGGLEG